MKLGKRRWTWEVWTVWIVNWALFAVDLIFNDDGKVFLASGAVMAFFHYMTVAQQRGE